MRVRERDALAEAFARDPDHPERPGVGYAARNSMARRAAWAATRKRMERYALDPREYAVEFPETFRLRT